MSTLTAEQIVQRRAVLDKIIEDAQAIAEQIAQRRSVLDKIIEGSQAIIEDAQVEMDSLKPTAGLSDEEIEKAVNNIL